MREAAKLVICEGFKRGCHVVLRGRRGTSRQSDVSAKAQTSFCVTGAILCTVFPQMT